jgi:hypothetical protein
MTETVIMLSASLLVLWLVQLLRQVVPAREFDPNWGGPYPSRASHQRAEMRRRYAESGLPPEPRHPYFDHLHRESRGSTGSG